MVLFSAAINFVQVFSREVWLSGRDEVISLYTR